MSVMIEVYCCFLWLLPHWPYMAGQMLAAKLAIIRLPTKTAQRKTAKTSAPIRTRQSSCPLLLRDPGLAMLSLTDYYLLFNSHILV